MIGIKSMLANIEKTEENPPPPSNLGASAAAKVNI
jgi:hypothetical protein